MARAPLRRFRDFGRRLAGAAIFSGWFVWANRPTIRPMPRSRYNGPVPTLAQLRPQFLLGMGLLRRVRLSSLVPVGLCATHHPMGRDRVVRSAAAASQVLALRPPWGIAEASKLVRRHPLRCEPVPGGTPRSTTRRVAETPPGGSLGTLRRARHFRCQVPGAAGTKAPGLGVQLIT